MFEQFIKTKGSTNFRKGPSTNYEIIRTVGPDTIFEIIEPAYGTTFAKAILTTTEEVGYVTTLSKYVDQYEPEWLTSVKKVIAYGNEYLGTPYVFGSSRTSDTSFDCSDFVQWCFKHVLGIVLPWDSRSQSVQGSDVDEENDLRSSDLIFFKDSTGRVYHVAIYVHQDLLLQTYNTTCDIYNSDLVKIAEDKGGVTWSSFKPGSYWRTRNWFAKRVL